MSGVIKCGDKVRIKRAAHDYENGWDNTWSLFMDAMVGQVVTVIQIDDVAGHKIAEDRYSYPYFIMERIE